MGNLRCTGQNQGERERNSTFFYKIDGARSPSLYGETRSPTALSFLMTKSIRRIGHEYGVLAIDLLEQVDVLDIRRLSTT